MARLSLAALKDVAMPLGLLAFCGPWVTVWLLLARVPEAGMLLGFLHAALRNPRLMLYKLCLKPPYTPPLRTTGAGQGQYLAILQKVVVNGTELSVVVRGKARARPILFLHGGPGMTEIPIFMPKQGALEEHYLCVHYDQRGSGTSGYHEGKLSVDMHVADCIALLEWIRENLSPKVAIVIGGSWGSMLGMIVAMRRPDLVCHLGLRGVFISGAHNEAESNRYLLAKMVEFGFARCRFSIKGFDHRAIDFVRSLEKVKSSDPDFAQKLLEQRLLLASLGGVQFFESTELPVPKWKVVKQKFMEIALAPEVSLKALLGFKKALVKSLNDMWHEMELWDATQVRLEMPVTVCHGRHDHNTYWGFIDGFMKGMQSPDKSCVWFDRSAHSPDKEETDKFIAVMLARMPTSEEEMGASKL